jgi:hypothetical protein
VWLRVELVAGVLAHRRVLVAGAPQVDVLHLPQVAKADTAATAVAGAGGRQR